MMAEISRSKLLEPYLKAINSLLKINSLFSAFQPQENKRSLEISSKMETASSAHCSSRAKWPLTVDHQERQVEIFWNGNEILRDSDNFRNNVPLNRSTSEILREGCDSLRTKKVPNVL